MNSFKEYFGDIGSFTTIIAFAFSVFVFYRYRRTKKPVYTLESVPLINENLKSISSLKITYAGSEVTSLTVSLIRFWNAGKATIHKNDMPTKAPLAIKTRGDVLIYSTQVIKNSDKESSIDFIYPESELNRIKETGQLKEFIIDFDFLDYNEVKEIKILHSGTSSQDLIVSGKVIGYGYFKEQNKKDKITLVYIIVIGVLMAVSLVSPFLTKNTQNGMFFKSNSLVLAILGGILIYFFGKSKIEG